MSAFHKDESSLAIVQFGRLQSDRIPNKLMQKVGAYSLAELGMMKLQALSTDKWHPIFICPPTDEALINLAQQYGIECLTFPNGFSGRIWPELIQPFLSYLQTFDWVMDINLMCHPLMGYDAIRSTINSIHESVDPVIIVKEERNPLWGIEPIDGERYYEVFCFHNRGELPDTRQNKPYYKPAHTAYFYPSHLLSLHEIDLAHSLHPRKFNYTPFESIDIDGPHDLLLAQWAHAGRVHLGSLDYNDPRPMIEGVAIGCGPSMREFAKTQLALTKCREDGKPIRFYGCGNATNYINGFDYYGYGDVVHRLNVPDPRGPHHPGCVTYAGTRNMNDMKAIKRDIPLINYCELDLPHGESSGGMALSMACLHHNIVGLTGFDGYRKDFDSDDIYDNFVRKFRFLINYWQNRGRRLVSLMRESIFNDILEPKIGCLPDIHEGKSRTV